MVDSHHHLRFDLFQQLVLWLSISMRSSRKGYHFLGDNPSLLRIDAEKELERLAIAHAEDKPEMRQPMFNHLALLRDAGRRGGTPAAIREAYINMYGGFADKLPHWLDIIEQHRSLLGRLRRPDRTTNRHLVLLHEALSYARQVEGTEDEIIAELSNELGCVLLQGPHRTSHIEQIQALEEAMACHQTALQTYTLERYPLQYAKTQTCLGNACLRYGILTGQQAAIERALACYHEALQVQCRDTFPEQWMMLQTSLGNAYAQSKGGDTLDNLEQAIACHEAALQQAGTPRTGLSPSSAWADTQINLGDAYVQRIVGERADNLRRAMRCYKAALQTYTPFLFPREWASIHVRLGDIFQTYILNGAESEVHVEEAQNRDMSLRCAIVCYEGAMQVYTTDSYPVEHASAQLNLGHAHRKRVGGDRQANLDQACNCYRSALHIFTEQAFPVEHQQAQISLAGAEAERQALTATPVLTPSPTRV
jgi:tetratricopeptide (TPR) repeat protein